MQTVLLTLGEPAGIGPDICLDVLRHKFSEECRIVIIGDANVLFERAYQLKRQVNIEIISGLSDPVKLGALEVIHVDCPKQVIPGVLNSDNAPYVLKVLDTAIDICKTGTSNIIVTAPISKEVINQAGIKFSGHTEYFAEKFNTDKVVMMLANQHIKVALVTTHMPLKEVADHITEANLNQTLEVIVSAFKKFGISEPKIAVCGLNPHAGEGGYMGQEEIAVINPIIKQWQDRGCLVSGSYPADTIFLQAKNYDLVLAMYHDQGLPVLKYSGFESGINVTLGLPIIRTSVDHGTALDLAATGKASSESLIHAIQFALNCNKNK